MAQTPPPGHQIDCRQLSCEAGVSCNPCLTPAPTPLVCDPCAQPRGFNVSYRGKTAVAYNGNQGNYATADDLCEAQYPRAHVCFVAEIEQLLQVTGDPGNDLGWCNAGPPGSHLENNNDCGGWQSASNLFYGRIWNFGNDTGGGIGLYTPCSSSLGYLCCSQP